MAFQQITREGACPERQTPKKKLFRLDGHTFTADRLVDGILVNPVLPSSRQADHQKWTSRFVVLSATVEEWDAVYLGKLKKGHPAWRAADAEWHSEGRTGWLARWPEGVVFNVVALDDGTWERYMSAGSFKTLAEALAAARGASALDESAQLRAELVAVS